MHPPYRLWGGMGDVLKGDDKRIMKTLMVCCIVLLLLSTAYAQEKRFTVPPEDSPSYGAADAPVTMIEFVDYQ